MWFLPSCRREATRRVAVSVVVSLVGLLSAVGITGNAQAERLFSDDVLVSGEPVGVGWHETRTSGQHCIEVRSDSVFTAWYGNGPAGHGIYMSRSLDGGQSFEAPRRVNDMGIVAYTPSLFVDECGNVHVVWVDKRDGEGPTWNIYFSMSADGGETFGPDVRVDDAGDDPSRQTDPAIAVDDSGRIYVVWLDERGDGGSGVYFSRSLDGGATFDSSIALPNSNENPPLGIWPQFGPSIAASGDGLVYVSYGDVWHVDNFPDEFIVVRRSSDCGMTFSLPTNVASYTNSGMTSIASPNSLEIYVAWSDLIDKCAYVAKSSDGGGSFGPPTPAGERPAYWLHDFAVVSLAANSAGWVAVAWKDSFDIVGFAESRDGAATFLPTWYMRGPDDRKYATVALGEDHTAYLAWTDYQHSSKGDIYLTKGVLDPPAAVWDEASDGPSEGFIRVRPNPFSSSVTLDFAWRSKQVHVGVYDLRGRLVRDLIGQEGIVTWDGLDKHGIKAAPGIYFIAASGESPGQGVKVVVSR